MATKKEVTMDTPKVLKHLNTLGVFIPFNEIPCQLVPAIYRQESHVLTICRPGVPYEVLLEYVQPESTDNLGKITPETLWLGLRPMRSSQDELEWINTTDANGKLIGLYWRMNQQYADDVEET
jgi:hypothetical protein